MRLCYLTLFMALAIVGAASGSNALELRIIGPGAATCEDFVRDIRVNPTMEREYFAWAQGFMSGVMLRAPTGVDEDINFNPEQFRVGEQIRAIRLSCIQQPSLQYADVVRAIYRQLGGKAMD